MDNSRYDTASVRTDRDIEYHTISRVTKMLSTAEKIPTERGRIEALHKNIQLWTIIASETADPQNKLSSEIRAGLIGLASFSIRHSYQCFSTETSLSALIDINKSIMKGLRGEGI